MDQIKLPPENFPKGTEQVPQNQAVKTLSISKIQEKTNKLVNSCLLTF